MFGVDLGSYLIGSGVWLAISFLAGGFIATASNIAGAFSHHKRDAIDWLIWFAICTLAVFAAGQACFWLIHVGVAYKQGTLFTRDAG